MTGDSVQSPKRTSRLAGAAGMFSGNRGRKAKQDKGSSGEEPATPSTPEPVPAASPPAYPEENEPASSARPHSALHVRSDSPHQTKRAGFAVAEDIAVEEKSMVKRAKAARRASLDLMKSCLPEMTTYHIPEFGDEVIPAPALPVWLDSSGEHAVGQQARWAVGGLRSM